MRVIYEVGGYNRKRYGKPWMARVVAWPIGGHPSLEFGGNVGDYTAEIEAAAGDLVKYGQKDHRGRGSENDFGFVEPDGSITRLTPAKARDYWIARQEAAAKPAAAADTDQRIAELEAALAALRGAKRDDTEGSN